LTPPAGVVIAGGSTTFQLACHTNLAGIKTATITIATMILMKIHIPSMFKQKAMFM